MSFFVGSTGITITPFYDLVSVTYEASKNKKIDTSLAMAIGDNFDIASITAYDLLSLPMMQVFHLVLLRKESLDYRPLL